MSISNQVAAAASSSSRGRASVSTSLLSRTTSRRLDRPASRRLDRPANRRLDRTAIRRLDRTAIQCVLLLGAAMLCGATALAQGPGVPTAGLAAPLRDAPNGYWYGSGCGGAGGQEVTVSVSPTPRPGGISTLTIDNLPANAAALWAIGWSAQQWAGVQLPLALDWLGLNGCSLLTAADVTVPFVAPGGSFAVPYVTPLTPVLAARPVFMQVMFEQPAANPGGLGLSAGYATRTAPMPAPTSWVTSITQHGITFQFAQAVRAGQFVNGDWFVVGPVQVTGMSPPCVVQNGRTINGAMVNPDPSTQNQGYDSTLFDPVHYSNTRNKAWGLSASNPLQLQPDDCLIKAISNLDPTELPVLRTCAVLTVLAEVPPQGSFRPAYAGDQHRVRFDEQMIDWAQLHDLPFPAGMPNVATQTAKFERCWLDHAPGWPTRYMHPVDNMPGYGRDLASLYNEAALMCHCAIPSAQKRLLAIRLIQIGIDNFGNVEGGAFWEGLGGHGSGRKLPILFAGALLDDQPMLSVGFDYPSQRFLNGTYVMHFGEDCQTFYVEQTGGNLINWGFGGYAAGDVGMPEWGFSHTHYPDNDHVDWTAGSYRQCCTANGWIGGVLCARMMGLVDLWNHPALFDYTDRFAQTEPPGWTRSWSPWVEDMWDLYRPFL